MRVFKITPTRFVLNNNHNLPIGTLTDLNFINVKSFTGYCRYLLIPFPRVPMLLYTITCDYAMKIDSTYIRLYEAVQ